MGRIESKKIDMLKYLTLLCFLFAASLSGNAQQTQSDSYTRYELLEPSSQSFRIIYDVTATKEGATFYFNTLRKGSEHKVDKVYDLMTGQELKWSIVEATIARENGHVTASADTDYLMVTFARAVPKDGEARIRIDKTYKDPKSYYEKDGQLIFERSLDIKRNSVVLPDGYEIVDCNYPSQIETTNGKIKASFLNRGNGAVNYKLTAKLLPANAQRIAGTGEVSPWAGYQAKPRGPDRSKARLDFLLRERAFQDREIVYYLQQPETHSFRLSHDYTESRVGINKYLNVVRPGSRASDPSAYILDTGEQLKVETLKGNEITAKGIDIGEEVKPETELVIIWFDAVKEGQSKRLRIWETYTDPSRYLIYNNELVWDRGFGRNRNDVVLPDNWYLTTMSIPATIEQLDDGRIQLGYINDRPDNMDVFLRARRRK